MTEASEEQEFFHMRVFKKSFWWYCWSDELDLGSGGCNTPTEALQEFQERLSTESVTRIVEDLPLWAELEALYGQGESLTLTQLKEKVAEIHNRLGIDKN